MKKFFLLLAGIGAAIVALLGLLVGKKEQPIDPHFDELKKPLEHDIQEISKKQENLKKQGVEDKTLEQELEYWKNQEK